MGGWILGFSGHTGVVAVPSRITQVEKRAVRNCALESGVREIYIIEEPWAAAIGSNIAINEPGGNMVVDIGGGTSDIAVISLNGIVISDSIRLGGNTFDELINFIKETTNKCKKENVDLQIYPDLDDDNIVKWYSNDEIEYKDAYCDHVDTSIRVRANGDVALCQYIENCFGNIKDKDLKDIVETEEYKSIANNLKNGSLFPICYNCCHLRFHKKEIDNKGNKKI